MRILYRVRQFWHTLSPKIDPQVLEQAYQYLAPPQIELFDRLLPSEKKHAVIMLNKLLSEGDDQPDLLVASLLHDIGKLQYPLHPLERTIIVVGKVILPRKAQRWGAIPAGGWENLPAWRKAFIVAEHHPEWGAEAARQAGASPLTVELIRSHHNPPPRYPELEQHRLQQVLWLVDNES